MTPVKGLIIFLMIGFLRAVFAGALLKFLSPLPKDASDEDKHSLLYLYTMQSKNSYSHLYDCTAVTLLNNRQIDFYNSSSDKPRTLKQNWLKNISQSDWKTSTEKPQYDRQLLNRLLDTQMSEFGHSESDGHVLQWRHGCEGEQSSDGSLTVLNSINKFGYDGEDLIQFNCTSKTWITPEKKKNREREEEWNKKYNVKKCAECEEMLKMYLKYKTTDITQSHTPPAVHVFAKTSVNDWSKVNLTCMATGFYPKDVKMSLRKFTTSLPDHLITSSGIRPNDDGTYQLRRSVEIQEDDSGDYNCYVNHSSLTEPVNKQWDERSRGLMIGVLVSGVLLFLYSVMCFILMMKNIGSSWVAVLGVVVLLCFVILGVVMMIKNERSWVSIIGCLVSGVVLLLNLLMIYVVMIKKYGRSWLLLKGVQVLEVGMFLSFAVLCVLTMIIIKYERSLDIIIGVFVSEVLLSVCSVILCGLMRRIIKHGRSWFSPNGVQVLGVEMFLYFACLMIKNERSRGLRIGVLVSVVLLSLCSVIHCVLMIIKYRSIRRALRSTRSSKVVSRM